jgi:predicted phosphodiesterase
MLQSVDLHIPSARHLGALDRPLLVCGGAYSNLEAFGAMLAEADRRGIPANRIVHTGDAVAYCGDALATTAALRASAIHAIKGNVELKLAENAADCGCGFDEGSACDLLARDWYAHARATMTPELCRWMGSLADALTFDLAGRRVRVVHGGVAEISRFLFASAPEAVLAAELEAADADIVLAGHTGLPFTRRVGGRVWHNSGALGLPANDGTPRVWISILDADDDGLSIMPVPLTYDHAAAAAKMRAAGRPEGYAAALETGLWPSLDVLPPAERARAGAALSPAPLRLPLPVRAPAPVA